MSAIKERDAGRDLDAEVAERVMGKCLHRELREHHEEGRREDSWWLECVACEAVGDTRNDFEPAQYSTSVHNAFLVVEAMRAKGYHFGINATAGDCARMTWSADFQRGKIMDGESSWSDTAPLAICLAALQALDASSPSSRSTATEEET